MKRTVRKLENSKQIARLLYIKGDHSQAETAELVGFSEVTLNRWAKAGDWRKLKAAKLMGRQQTLQRLYEQMNEQHTAIESRPEGKRYANSKEADTMVKLTAAIEKLKAGTSVATILEVFMMYKDWLIKNKDFQTAKAFLL